MECTTKAILFQVPMRAAKDQLKIRFFWIPLFYIVTRTIICSLAKSLKDYHSFEHNTCGPLIVDTNN